MNRVLLIASVFAVVGCSTERVYECSLSSTSQCRNSDGTLGVCLSPGFCAFSDTSCTEEDLRWHDSAGNGLANTCVNSRGGNGDGGDGNLCGGTAQLDGTPGQACGVCDSGSFVCDGQDAVRCEGELTLEQSVLADGATSVSSTFSGSFQKGLATDGDLSTSWFSAGSDTDGTESVFSWIATNNECITTIGFVGNEFHSNSQFREDFGYGQVTFEVRDASDAVLFSKIESLAGTPDPQLTINTGGVLGRSVHLRLQGHESSDCGGFSELTVNGVR